MSKQKRIKEVFRLVLKPMHEFEARLALKPEDEQRLTKEVNRAVDKKIETCTPVERKGKLVFFTDAEWNEILTRAGVKKK